jgi:serine/threonine-protein kinase
MSADRNLLFGMLALHAGLVTREQLLEAFNAWMLDKEVSLGEILQARGALDGDDRRMLDGLVERQVKRHGDARRSLAAMSIDRAARRDLERLADADVQASLAATPGPAAGTVPPLSGPSEPAPRSGGEGLRYRRLLLHAKGGLGEVHLALDEELQRNVALEEIQERFADDADSRRRFVREAQITGNLEHPGVVPVYGLLADPDGRPIYAMRFIKGESLHDAITGFHLADKDRRRDPGERSLAFRGLLSRFVAVCNAVAYAHSRGVIHRDLKPGNVMLGAYGETLVVDWGLARVLVQPDPELTPHSLVRVQDADMATQLGKALGTPAYMPPEQARGEHDRVGIQSDVFALGATLYALLTGKAPYRDLEQAKLGDFAAPRQVNALVPRALEAVCRKAMAARPEERYATARALAEDVEHWLADEPVTAHREPVTVRLRRWGRRNRTLVTSGVVRLVAGVLGLSVGLWAVDRERARTKAEWERAEENFEQARLAVDECFGLANDDPLFQGEHMRKVRQQLLRKTLPFYERFTAERPEEEPLLARQAEYLHRVALITAEIDRKADALKSYERARDIRMALSQAHPEVTEYQNFLALTLNDLSVLQTKDGNPQGALKSIAEAIRVNLALHQREPSNQQFRKNLRNTHWSRAETLAALGRHREAIADCDEALRLNPTPLERALIRVQRASSVAHTGEYRHAMAEVDALATDAVLPLEAPQHGLPHGETLCNLARDNSRPLAEREKQVEVWSGQAVAMLQRAAKGGYFREPANRAHLDKDADLAFLRGRDDFRAFVASLPAAKAPGR